ncbi:MAG TPA: hypothetical protein VMH41_16995 [Mycobacteriales bacterium]|nr:hypothetical protein [Mycobacteriales bacterium]
MPDAIISNTFQAATSGFTLVDGSTVSAGTGWQGRLRVASPTAPTLVAQYLARGQGESSVLALIASAWNGNVDAEVFLEQTSQIQLVPAVSVPGTTLNWLVAGVVLSRGAGDDPTHFASCTATLEIYDDASGLITAVSPPLDWTTMAVGQSVSIVATEFQSDPTQWAVLQRRWRVHWQFTVTDGGSPNPVMFHGEPQFTFSSDGSLPAYSANPQGALTAGVIDITLASGTFNDLSPANITTLTRIRMNQGASCTVTGLVAGSDGQRLLIENVSAYDILLTQFSAASETGNLFYFPLEGYISSGDFGAIIAPNQTMEFIYSAATGSIPAGWYPIAPGIVDLDDELTQVVVDSTAVAVGNNVASVAAGVAHQHYVSTTDGPSGANVSIDAAPSPATAGTIARAAHGHELVTYSGTPAANSGSGGPGNSGDAPSRGTHFHPAGGGAHWLYGDGSDGSVTISVNTTLSRDMYYSSLTINNGIVLTTAGFAIYCSGTITNNGTIDNSGGAGGSKVAGAGAAAGRLGGGTNGGAGTSSVGAGAGGTVLNNAMGGAGGAGGGDGTHAGGGAGTLNAPTALVGTPRAGIEAALALFINGSGAAVGLYGGGTGGGGGAYASGTQSGSGGGGGGVILICAKVIANGSGVIRANGGNGSAGTGSGSAGGGGGGGGGLVILIYDSLTGPGTITAALGSGAAKIGSGVAGSNGSAGLVLELAA